MSKELPLTVFAILGATAEKAEEVPAAVEG